jgi:hypothetical protein
MSGFYSPRLGGSQVFYNAPSALPYQSIYNQPSSLNGGLVYSRVAAPSLTQSIVYQQAPQYIPQPQPLVVQVPPPPKVTKPDTTYIPKEPVTFTHKVPNRPAANKGINLTPKRLQYKNLPDEHDIIRDAREDK